MHLKAAAAFLLAVLATTAFTGCVFLPQTSAPQGSDDSPSLTQEPEEVISETDAVKDPDLYFDEDEYQSDHRPAVWPEVIPKPEGEPVDGNDGVTFYLVDGDIDFYEEYTETLLGIPDAELLDRDERADRNPSVVIRIGEYSVLVMHHPDNDWVSVGVQYFLG